MHVPEFEVSVIIPVYNAEKYILRAIKSALEQDEVKEVIVVDDGYADSAYDKCLEFAKTEPRVKLYTHANHENKGAAVSINLGILNASCNYIAFLDADDYYLANRFKFTKETFEKNVEIEAVYEPVGYLVSTDHALDEFKKIKERVMREANGDINAMLSYTKTPYSGIELFKSMVIGGNDGPHTNGVTMKRNLVSKVGLFNPILRLHQDTEYWFRLSYLSNISLTDNHTLPVAIREMHDANRTYHQDNVSGFKLWQAIVGWASTQDMDKEMGLS